MNDKQKFLTAMAILSTEIQTTHPRFFDQFIKTKPKKKCLLSGCDELTENGYCCARHCEIDKESGKNLPKGKKKLSRKQRKIKRKG